jgi:hypothetical protein
MGVPFMNVKYLLSRSGGFVTTSSPRESSVRGKNRFTDQRRAGCRVLASAASSDHLHKQTVRKVGKLALNSYVKSREVNPKALSFF